MKSDDLKFIGACADAASPPARSAEVSAAEAELHALRRLVADLCDYMQRLPGHDVAREELILRIRLLQRISKRCAMSGSAGSDWEIVL